MVLALVGGGNQPQVRLPAPAAGAVLEVDVVEQGGHRLHVVQVPRDGEGLARQALQLEQFRESASTPLPRAVVPVHVVEPLDQLLGGRVQVSLLVQPPCPAQVLVQIDEGVETVVPLDHGWTSARMRSAASACSLPPRSADSSTTQWWWSRSM